MKKLFITIGIILGVLFGMGINVYCHSGVNDNYGGHFVQKDGVAVAYHYHEGDNKGWELMFNERIAWDDRNQLNRPFNRNDNSLGTWNFYENSNFADLSLYNVIPVANTTDIALATSDVTGTVDSSSSTQSNLPKTGESDNTLIFGMGISLLIGGSVVLFRRLKSNKM